MRKGVRMRGRKMGALVFAFILAAMDANGAWGAYHHGGDTDSDVFAGVYTATRETKLDSCALCHSGGAYEKSPGNRVSLGSCQWCHHEYGYDATGDIDATLNPYGRDYKNHGRNAAALLAIEDLDSDGDTFGNRDEITAVRFPGNADDDPTKVPAPYRVYTREELEAMPQHNQFLLMNTSKSGDYYAEYGGVTVADMLDEAGILAQAQSIQVVAPDGWSQYHPLEPDGAPLFYHVYGCYPVATFYYSAEADADLADDGWCDYSAPSCDGRSHGDVIAVDNGLQLLLAIRRDGGYLTDGVLTADNKLDGEGPFRVVTPQNVPGPPDQSSKLPDPGYLWPYDNNADHNAGFATRSATIIRVDPLPAGTTDIDTAEAGWSFVDSKKIVVYGAIDPLPTITEKLNALYNDIKSMGRENFRGRLFKQVMLVKLCLVQRLIAWQKYRPATALLEKQLMKCTDGCVTGQTADRNDWLEDCQAQKRIYWAIHEILVLMDTLD